MSRSMLIPEIPAENEPKQLTYFIALSHMEPALAFQPFRKKKVPLLKSKYYLTSLGCF